MHFQKKKSRVSLYYKIRAELYVKLGKIKEAIWNFRQAAEMSYAVDKECHKRLSELFFSVGQYKEAIDGESTLAVNDMRA